MAKEEIPGWDVDKERLVAKKEMKDQIVLKIEDLQWDDHPINDLIKLCFLLTKKRHGVEGTVMMARVPVGDGIAEHNHEEAHDLIIPIAGKAKFWINGLGEFVMEKGVVFSIPPGISHRLFDVTEDIEILDVYIPPIL